MRAFAAVLSPFSLTVILFLLTACQPGPTDQTSSDAITGGFVTPDTGSAQPWTRLEALDDPNDFHFAIVSDRTGSARPGVFAGAMDKINLLSPAFVVSVGDLIEGYTDDQQQLDREWDEIESFVGKLDSPFFYTPGNHDMNNAVMAETWRQRFGPSYYHFLYKDVLFVVLNSELFGMVGSPQIPVPGPWQQAAQMKFVAQVLAQYPSPRWTIVLIHQPLWDNRDIHPDWLEVESLLGQRDYTVFAGHFHQYNHVQRNNRKFITLATTGGGSSLRGEAFGEFDQVAWVTMRDDGPQIANVDINGVMPDDVSDNSLRRTLTGFSQGIQVNTPMASAEMFEQVRHLVTLHNPGTQPLTVAPALAQPGSFTVEGLLPVSVLPGAEVEIPLTLSATAPIPYKELQAAAVDWTLTTTIGERPVQFTHRSVLLPLTEHTLEMLQNPVTLDGDLTEWGSLRYHVQRQGDVTSQDVAADDVSFRFDVRLDAEALYVAVDVIDDDVQQYADKIPRSQDAITLSIDPREAAARERSMHVGAAVLGGDMAKTIVAMLTPGEAAEDKLLPFLAENAAVIQSETVTTPTGYRSEILVPLSLVNERAGSADWREVRIALSVYDLDEGDGVPLQLHWQPYRYGNAPLAGTHRFVRNP
ncbi:MAG: metallophosphoesterase [Pseudomonadota bacterium]